MVLAHTVSMMDISNPINGLPTHQIIPTPSGKRLPDTIPVD